MILNLEKGKYNKTAFTLAEIMITLTVIGIISAIIMPIAINSVPDENVLKFKKANSTLYQAIQELVNSDKYYKDGDLIYKPDGTIVDDAKYFCNTLADVINTKKVNCLDINTGTKSLSHYNLGKLYLEEKGIETDYSCLKAVERGMKAEIVMQDGVEFYQTNPAWHFGSRWGDNIHNSTDEDALDSSVGDRGLLFGEYGESSVNSAGFYAVYKPVCIDVDGIGKGIDPFAYGIRNDGKIIMSKRAQEWLEKDIQGEK